MLSDGACPPILLPFHLLATPLALTSCFLGHLVTTCDTFIDTTFSLVSSSRSLSSPRAPDALLAPNPAGMFYSNAVLTKGSLAKIWLAAHMESKLTKNQIGAVDVEQSVSEYSVSLPLEACSIPGRRMSSPGDSKC
jgi:hypothetical protein